MLSYIKFLRTISRQRVSTRQIHQVKLISLITECTHFGIHRYTAIVTYMLVTARSHIKQRRFSAVRITHQRHVDGTSFSLRYLFHFLLANGSVYRYRVKIRSLPLRVVACFLFAHHLYHGSLIASKRNLVSHDFVFHGVFQRSIEQDFYGFSFDEAHLYNSAPEPTVSHHFDDDTFFSGF